MSTSNKNTRPLSKLRRYQSYFAILKLAVVKIRGRLPFTLHVSGTFVFFTTKKNSIDFPGSNIKNDQIRSILEADEQAFSELYGRVVISFI